MPDSRSNTGGAIAAPHGVAAVKPGAAAKDSHKADAVTGQAGDDANGKPGKKPAPRWWKPLKRVLTVGFLLAVIALLVMQGRAVDWDEVGGAISRMRRAELIGAALLTVVSFAVYSCYDLLGRAYTKHGLGRVQVMTVAFISYAFNLNMGSLIGGVGFRYRLYSKLGLENGVITRILGLSLVTNWIGYLCLAGIVFSARLLDVPDNWKVTTNQLQWAGFAFLAIVAAYLCMCAFAKRREFKVRGHELHLPPLRMAFMQLALSMTNWLLMAAVVYLLFAHRIPFVTVFCVLMISSVAGIITHVPAGLGVLEAVFVTLLGGQLPKGEVLASLLAYRAIYFIAPLAIATIVYGVTEARTRRRKAG